LIDVSICDHRITYLGINTPAAEPTARDHGTEIRPEMGAIRMADSASPPSVGATSRQHHPSGEGGNAKQATVQVRRR
jgi:hypothetical protein